jgi:hypothetical protein
MHAALKKNQHHNKFIPMKGMANQKKLMGVLQGG